MATTSDSFGSLKPPMQPQGPQYIMGHAGNNTGMGTLGK